VATPSTISAATANPRAQISTPRQSTRTTEGKPKTTPSIYKRTSTSPPPPTTGGADEVGLRSARRSLGVSLRACTMGALAANARIDFLADRQLRFGILALGVASTHNKAASA
jgi:hypothetical protein